MPSTRSARTPLTRADRCISVAKLLLECRLRRFRLDRTTLLTCQEGVAPGRDRRFVEFSYTAVPYQAAAHAKAGSGPTHFDQGMATSVTLV